MRKKKILITLLATVVSVVVIFIVVSIISKQRETAIEVEQTTVESVILSNKLSECLGSVVVGTAVDSELSESAVAAVIDKLSEDVAIYIFAAAYDRDDIPYVSYTLYNAKDNSFIDADEEIDIDKVYNGPNVIYETEDTRIDMRK